MFVTGEVVSFRCPSSRCFLLVPGKRFNWEAEVWMNPFFAVNTIERQTGDALKSFSVRREWRVGIITSDFSTPNQTLPTKLMWTGIVWPACLPTVGREETRYTAFRRPSGRCLVYGLQGSFSGGRVLWNNKQSYSWVGAITLSWCEQAMQQNEKKLFKFYHKNRSHAVAVYHAVVWKANPVTNAFSRLDLGCGSGQSRRV